MMIYQEKNYISFDFFNFFKSISVSFVKSICIFLLAFVATFHQDSFSQEHKFSEPVALDVFRVGEDDLSIQVLRRIFGPSVFSDHYSKSASPSDKINEKILGGAFRMFNAGMLIFGSLLFAYASIIGTIKTATDGEFMGKKWSSVWVPIRFALGVPFLFPTVSGYSVAQMIVMAIALQGVGVANAVWSAAVDAFSDGGVGIVKPELASKEVVTTLVLNIIRAETCVADLNNRDPSSTEMQMQYAPSGEPVYLSLSDKSYGYNDSLMFNYFEWGAIGPNSKNLSSSVCGRLKISEGNFNQVKVGDVDFLEVNQLRSAQRDAIKAVRSLIGASKVPSGLSSRYRIDSEGNVLPSVEDDKLFSDFSALIRSSTDVYIETMTKSSKTISDSYTKATADFIKNSKEQGWITAGFWYFQMARVSSDLAQVTKYVGEFKPAEAGDNGISHVTDGRFKSEVKKYFELMEMTAVDEKKIGLADKTKVGIFEDDAKNGESKLWWGFRKALDLPNGIGPTTKTAAELFGYDVNNGAHPIVQLKSVGDYTMGTIESIYAAGVVSGIIMEVNPQFKLAKSVTKTKDMVSKITKSGGVLDTLINPIIYLAVASALSLFVFGCIMSLYLPLIPFIIWIGSILGWITSVFEMIVAAPVWVAAHLHPEGEDMAGKWGSNGYMLLVEIFGRPVFMVFGLLGAYVICEPFMGLMTTAFWSAAGSVQSDSLHGLFSLIIVVMIFTTLCITMMHRIFSLIHVIPNTIIKWVGGHQSGHDMSSQDQDKISQNVSRGAGTIGSSAQAGITGAQGAKDKKNREKAVKAAAEAQE